MATKPTIHPNKTGDHTVRQDVLRMIRRKLSIAPRTMQTEVGPSQIGTPCDRSLAHTIGGPLPVIEEADALTAKPANPYAGDPMPALVGTALHTWLEDAAGIDNMIEANLPTVGNMYRRHPRWLTELEVHATRPLSGKKITGHVDLIDTHTNAVIDYKSLGATSMKKITGLGEVPDNYLVQLQVYGLAVQETLGLHPEVLGIIAIPRNGPLVNLKLLTFDYDPGFAVEALTRLDDIDTEQKTYGWDSLPISPSDEACRWCAVSMNDCPEGNLYR